MVTIHNLAYQGIADGSWLERIGPDGSHYEWWGGTNPRTNASFGLLETHPSALGLLHHFELGVFECDTQLIERFFLCSFEAGTSYFNPFHVLFLLPV